MIPCRCRLKERARLHQRALRPLEREFQGIEVYRSGDDLEASRGTGHGPVIQRFDQLTTLFLGIETPPRHVQPSHLPDAPSSEHNRELDPAKSPVNTSRLPITNPAKLPITRLASEVSSCEYQSGM